MRGARTCDVMQNILSGLISLSQDAHHHHFGFASSKSNNNVPVFSPSLPPLLCPSYRRKDSSSRQRVGLRTGGEEGREEEGEEDEEEEEEEERVGEEPVGRNPPSFAMSPFLWIVRGGWVVCEMGGVVQRRTKGEIRGEERERSWRKSNSVQGVMKQRPQTTDTTDHTPHAQPSQRLQWVQGMCTAGTQGPK